MVPAQVTEAARICLLPVMFPDYPAHMEPNRTHAERFDVDILLCRAEQDSIVDCLFDLPAPADEGSDHWQAGVKRRLEKVLADRIRARIEGKAA